MNPSNFTIEPWSSVFYNSECKAIARNIMIILKRTGDTWRKLDWTEYMAERQKDGASEYAVNREKRYFGKVINHTVSEETARLFSPKWKAV